MIPTVYLCGGIYGLTKAGITNWREEAKKELGFTFTILDPTRNVCDYDDAESIKNIVNTDLADIDKSHVILANVTQPSWGTAMEIFYASRLHKLVIGFGVPPSYRSTWLVHHCTALVSTLQDALFQVKRFGSKI